MSISPFLQGWLAGQNGARTGILVDRKIIELANGNGNDAILLSQIIYWFSPTQSGQSRLRVNRHNKMWIAKSYEDWQDEIGINHHTVRKSIGRLKKQGLIETKTMKFMGTPKTHVRLCHEILEQELKKIYSLESSPPDRIGQVQLTDSVKSNCPNRSDPLTESTDKEYEQRLLHQTGQPGLDQTANAGLDGAVSEHDPFSLFNQDGLEDNCTSLGEDFGTDRQLASTGHVPNIKDQEPRGVSSRKLNKPRLNKPRLSDGYTTKQWGNAMGVAKALVEEYDEALNLRMSENLVAACVGVTAEDAGRVAAEVYHTEWADNPVGLLICKLKELKYDPIGDHEWKLIEMVERELKILQDNGKLRYHLESDHEYLYAFPGDEEWSREKTWALPRGYRWSNEDAA